MRQGGTDASAQLPNLCAMEINEIRPFFAKAMSIMIQLTPEQQTTQEQNPAGMDDFNFDDDWQMPP